MGVLIYTSRRKTGSTLKTEQREAKEAWSLRRAGKSKDQIWMSNQLFHKEFMESLILAQDERWRRA